jgi:hypothetical protein
MSKQMPWATKQPELPNFWRSLGLVCKALVDVLLFSKDHPKQKNW